MPRFVVLRHDMPPHSSRPTHWDFMVEMGNALRTWALAEEPAADREIAATPLADHRLAYLDYEGPVSGNRGYVTQWDRGECTIQEATDERTILVAHGQKLTGRIQIKSTQAASPKAAFLWQVSFPTSNL